MSRNDLTGSQRSGTGEPPGGLPDPGRAAQAHPESSHASGSSHGSAGSWPEVPYPPVFHDWEFDNRRVATSNGIGGVCVETTMGVDPAVWQRVELTEDDACLLALSLLEKAAHIADDPRLERIAKRVRKDLGKLQ